MAERRTARTRAKPANGEELSKAELQREMQQTRESLAVTVEDIRETVNDQYQTVKETVSGVLDFRVVQERAPDLESRLALGGICARLHHGVRAQGD